MGAAVPTVAVALGAGGVGLGGRLKGLGTAGGATRTGGAFAACPLAPPANMAAREATVDVAPVAIGSARLPWEPTLALLLFRTGPDAEAEFSTPPSIVTHTDGCYTTDDDLIVAAKSCGCSIMRDTSPSLANREGLKVSRSWTSTAFDYTTAAR